MIDISHVSNISRYFESDWYRDTFHVKISDPDELLYHYLTYGEHVGYWPNRIFNPVFYKETHGLNNRESQFLHFMETGLDSLLAPCRFFNMLWYQSKNPDYLVEGDCVLHYLRRGIPEGRDPCAWVDIASISRFTSPMGINDLVYSLESGGLDVNVVPGVTLGVVDLAKRQRRFLEGISIEKVKSSQRCIHGRNLVFVQAAEGANCWRWLNFSRPRKWDLLINCYQDKFPEAYQAEHVFVQKGTKFTGMLNIWRNHSEVFDLYDYVFFVDDDIILKYDEVDVFFSIIDTYGLDLAQPSLSKDSYCSWPVFRRKALEGVRFVNAVEIMMPAVSRRARGLWLPYFIFSMSGFGLDLITQLLNLKAGVVDTVEAIHPRAINQSNGDYYEFLRQNNINVNAELARVLACFKVECSLRELTKLEL